MKTAKHTTAQRPLHLFSFGLSSINNLHSHLSFWKTNSFELIAWIGPSKVFSLVVTGKNKAPRHLKSNHLSSFKICYISAGKAAFHVWRISLSMEEEEGEENNAVSIRYSVQTWVPQFCRKVGSFQHCIGVSKYVNKPSHRRKKNDLSVLHVWAACGALDAGYAWMVFLAAWQMQLPRFLSSMIVKSPRFLQFGTTFSAHITLDRNWC